MAATIILSPAVMAHPLATRGMCEELQALWHGEVRGAAVSPGVGADHAEWDVRRAVTRLLARDPEAHPTMVIVDTQERSLDELRSAFPTVRLELAVVGADAHDPRVILAAVERVLGVPAELW